VPEHAELNIMPEPTTPTERSRGYCVAYFGNVWSTENRTSSHHIARRLAACVPVLYIETPGMRKPALTSRDARKIWRNLLAWFAPPRRIHDSLHVMTLPQIPFRSLPLAGRLNQWLGRWRVKRALRRLGFTRYLSWFVVPHPGKLAGKLGERLVVYYCIDDYSALPGVDEAAIRQFDDELTRKADVVFVASSTLLESKRALNEHVHFSPHGVDMELFARSSDPSFEPTERVRSLTHPVIGYFGTLSEVLDYELLTWLARSRPNWTFLMIGLVASPVGELAQCSNVVLPGPQPYEDLPRWAKAFDVAILPHRMTRFVKHANPLKLREYLATGKPVVAVVTPETSKFAEYVYLATDYATYLEAIETALREDCPEARQRRMASVAGASWESRFQETLKVVEETLDAKTTPGLRP
jgi:glycosyltransferase involved in cell wall biosynthesis